MPSAEPLQRLLKLLLASCLLCAALWSPPAVAVAPAVDAMAGQVITALRVEGNRRVEDAAVLAAVGLAPGDRLQPAALRRDIRAVMRTGFFRDVRVYWEEGGVLVFQVVENPAIREVRYDGNKKVSDDDIAEVVNLAPFAVLNDTEVRLNQQNIRDLYLEKGYFLAEVEPEVVPVNDDQVDVVFHITENHKVIVQDVDITGNENVPDRKIIRYLATKPGGILPWLTSAGTFSPENVENDVYIVRSVYLEEGYVDVQVDEPKVYLSPDKRFVHVSIHVTEGRRYKVGRVDADGDWKPEEGLTREAVQRIIEGASVAEVQEDGVGPAGGALPPFRNPDEVRKPLKSGEWFKLSTVQSVMQRITDLYADQGYAFASVVPLTETDPETGVVNITFSISAGRKVRVGRINITGNDPTWDKTIRREIPLNEGQTYSGSAVKEARSRLERLGFFEEVRISTPRGEGEDVLDMNVEVVEQPTGSFSVGAGFSSLDQFLFTANISKNNFLGLGYVMSAAVQWSANRQQGTLSFADPHLLDSRWTLKVDAYSISQSYVEDQTRRGGGISVGRYLDEREDWRLSLDYVLEDVELASITPYQEALFGGQLYATGLTSTLGLNLYVDKRNNRINPTQGLYASVSTGLSGGFRVDDRVVNLLGGDFNLWETKANLRVFQPVIPDKDILIFRFNTTLGYIRSTDGSVVPYIHRYRAGGINSVRGYDWFSLGPTIRNVGSEDPAGAEDRLIVGGTQSWINNFELEAPIVKAAGISAVAFFDAGNAFGDPYGEGNINLQDLRLAYGFGLRWFSPIGPLRFELGFPIHPEEDMKKSVFDFSIGSFF